MTNFQKAIKIGAICLAVFLIINIVGGLFIAISFITGFESVETDKNDTVIVEEIKTYDAISNLNIKLKTANLEIVKGNEFKIESSGYEDKLSIKESNNAIKIEEMGSFFWEKDFNGKIIIYIPSSSQLKQIDLETGAGSLQIDSIEAQKFDLEQGAGTISIDNCTFKETEIDGGAGKTVIKDSKLGRLDLDAGVGKVTINAELYGNSEIDSGVGDIDLTLTGGESLYSIYTEKGIGSIKINNEKYKNNTTYGSGFNKVKISGGIGSIDIQFS